jgi:hypothetical protein
MINLLEQQTNGGYLLSNALPRVQRQRFRFDVSRDTPACPSLISSTEIKNDMEHWWNNTDGGKPKYSHALLNDGDTF